MLINNGRLYQDPRRKASTEVAPDPIALGDGVFANIDASRGRFGIFLARVNALSLSVEEQVAMIGGVPRRTFFRWQRLHASKGALRLKSEVFQRIDVVGEILGLVIDAHEDKAAAAMWLRAKQNAGPFKGRVPLKELLKGDFAIQLRLRDRLWKEREQSNSPQPDLRPRA